MAAVPTLKKYAGQFWSLGFARVFLILAIVLSLLALATPIWSTQRGTPGLTSDWTSTSYSWTSRTIDAYESGSIRTTTIEYYSNPGFPSPGLASSVSASYLAILVFVILLFILVVIFSTKWGRSMPRMGLLVVAVLGVLLGLLALFYPLATVPSAAAAAAPSLSSVSGFWGSTGPAPPLAWGAGLAWYLLLVAVILGIVGAALPYLKHMRGAPETNPRAWRPSQ